MLGFVPFVPCITQEATLRCCAEGSAEPPAAQHSTKIPAKWAAADPNYMFRLIIHVCHVHSECDSCERSLLRSLHLQVYDADTNAWAAAPSMNEKRAYFSSVLYQVCELSGVCIMDFCSCKCRVITMHPDHDGAPREY